MGEVAVETSKVIFFNIAQSIEFLIKYKSLIFRHRKMER
jgi:hypothetical protein